MQESIQLSERNVQQLDLRTTKASSSSVKTRSDADVEVTRTDQTPQTGSEGDSEPCYLRRKRVEWGRIQIATLCYCLFMEGWNDGSLGPLLLKIQSVYHVDYTIVSLIFVITVVGCCIGTMVNVYGTERIGFGKLMVIGLSLQTISHCIQASRPPFTVFAFSYGVFGVGSSIYLSQANGFAASIKRNRELKLGLVQAAFGVGAFSSPLVATQFAHKRRWNLYYISSVCMASLAVALVVAVFRLKNQEDCLKEIGQDPANNRQATDKTPIRQILSYPVVHSLTLFIFFYVGVEVTMGGWIVTYIVKIRGGGPSSGYISSGFFGGIAIGRIALIWLTSKVGENKAIFLYSGIILGLELIVWFVPSLVGDAISVSLVGVLLGPFYPIALSYTSQLMPRWILTGAIGWISGLGQIGSAALPFATGALSNRFGIKSLQPFVIAMLSCMIVMWSITQRLKSRYHRD